MSAAATPAELAAMRNAVGAEQEFSFGAADFERVRQLIYQRAGISLHAGKQAMVYSRLSRRLRDTGQRSFSQYLQWLESATGAAAEQEWQEFINCLTTNLTSFFREDHHFHALADELKAHFMGRNLRIWCNAASTGEEPYSIAMTCVEALGASAPAKIFASDIDTKVLATAQRGIYKTDGVKGLSPERLQRFFMRGKASNAGLMRVKPELQKHMEFLSVNLIENLPFREPFDVVFCRNVMIYFDAATQRTVLERIHRVMKPGGLLFVGHAENFSESRDLFTLKGKTVYERR